MPGQCLSMSVAIILSNKMGFNFHMYMDGFYRIQSQNINLGMILLCFVL